MSTSTEKKPRKRMTEAERLRAAAGSLLTATAMNTNTATIAERVSTRRAVAAKRELESLSIEELDDLITKMSQQINKYAKALPSLYRIHDEKIDTVKRNLNAIYANVLKVEHSPMTTRATGSIGMLHQREKQVKHAQIRKMKEAMEELSKAAAAAKKERERERRATRRAATVVATAASTGGGSAVAAPAENAENNLDPMLAEMLGGLQFGGSRSHKRHSRKRHSRKRRHH